MKEERKCAYCGKPFIAIRANAKYCSLKCRDDQQKINQSVWHKAHNNAKKNGHKTRESEALNDKIRSAREAGMSYGKYVAMQYIESQWKRD